MNRDEQDKEGEKMAPMSWMWMFNWQYHFCYWVDHWISDYDTYCLAICDHADERMC